jgi:hypothetical protein
MLGYETCTIINYDDDVRGVDLADYTQYYTMAGDQFKKYNMKTFHHMMDMCVLHVYHVHRNLRGNEKQLTFLINLAKKPTQKYGKPHPTVSRKAITTTQTSNLTRALSCSDPSNQKTETNKMLCCLL